MDEKLVTAANEVKVEGVKSEDVWKAGGFEKLGNPSESIWNIRFNIVRIGQKRNRHEAGHGRFCGFFRADFISAQESAFIRKK